MADALRKVRRGEKLNIPATTYNAFVDAARAEQRRSFPNGRGPNALIHRNTGIVRILNDSGEDVGRFGVLGIDDTILDPTTSPGEFASKPTLAGATPADTLHYGKFAVLLEPIADGKIGLAAVDGVSVGKVNILNPYHIAADIVDGSTANLESSTTGNARILWRESGSSGLKWAILQLGEPYDVGMYEAMVPVTTAQNVKTWDWNPLHASLGTVLP